MSTLRTLHRMPEFWLVAGIPLLTIAAGIATIFIAAASGSAEAVIDPVERTGPVQVLRDEADRRAARLGLSARLVLDEARRLVLVELFPPGKEAIALTFAHPTRRSLDHRLLLEPAGEGRYLAPLALPSAHHWNLSLSSEDGGWRLVGRYRPGAGETWLRPALPAP